MITSVIENYKSVLQVKNGLVVVGGVVSYPAASTAGTGEEPGAVNPHQRSHPLAGGRDLSRKDIWIICGGWAGNCPPYRDGGCYKRKILHIRKEKYGHIQE